MCGGQGQVVVKMLIGGAKTLQEHKILYGYVRSTVTHFNTH